jgi:diaminopimelate epimerase
VGSDGILVSDSAPGGRFSVLILNPDGSEAEKSGNGLRILSRYLYDQGCVSGERFAVVTAGGTVTCQVREGGHAVFVEMGTARFDSVSIPVAGPPREVVDEEIEVAGERLRFTAVTVGNPHCVVHVDDLAPELALWLGPELETHELFPNRTNVQFVRVLDRRRVAIEIWERGAGYTLASGSSSCAAAAASVRLGLCDGDVTVLMPGGRLQIGVDEAYGLTMLGPVAKVADGFIAREVLEDAG